jgi:hypothetical protein
LRCCEYYLIHESDAAFAHEVDHIISRKHGGQDSEDNLAYACFACNRFKGSDLGSLGPEGAFVLSFIRACNPGRSTSGSMASRLCRSPRLASLPRVSSSSIPPSEFWSDRT